MAKVILEKGREQKTQEGHPWVYRTEIARIDGNFAPGDVVAVEDWRGRFLGKGFFNPLSVISVRLLTRQKDEEINTDFWLRRLEAAWQYRQKVLAGAATDSFRVVFGEADFLPGLIVDKYAGCLVIQTLSAGIDRHIQTIAEILDGLARPKAIYERNDSSTRDLEGLERRSGFLKGWIEQPVTITENGLKFLVDVVKGQKTGHFLDQRENRAAIRPLVGGGRVLDCFCHTGGFGLHAAFFGAREVLGLDVSAEAVKTAQDNARLNGLENTCTFKAANVFDALREMDRDGEKYDAVILDPPAFVKSRRALEGAVRGYKEINLRAFKILAPGGFLVTCSCSYHMPEELFLKTVIDAARDARRTVRIVARRGQAPDHPWLAGYDESRYLKCFILQAL